MQTAPPPSSRRYTEVMDSGPSSGEQMMRAQYQPPGVSLAMAMASTSTRLKPVRGISAMLAYLDQGVTGGNLDTGVGIFNP